MSTSQAHALNDSDSPGGGFITQLVESFRFEDAKLPSLPDAVIYLESAIRDNTVSLAVLANLLEKDPVLAARLIRVANSVYYRSVEPIEDVPAAVTRIGFSATRNIALVLLGNSFTARHELVAQKIAELWEESLRTSAITACLSKYYPLADYNRAMLGGLMYNVGAMLLLTKIDEKVQTLTNPIVLDHMLDKYSCQFGRQLLEHWEMDPDLVDVAGNRNQWHRMHVHSADLTDLTLVARYCSDATEEQLRACELLPCYQRIQKYAFGNHSLPGIVAEAQDAIDETFTMLTG